MMNKQGGIYSFVSPNGKMYVGSTNYFGRRFSQYKSNYKHKRHDGMPKLFNAFIKYGFENFEFCIIEVIEDFDKLLEREQFWFNFFKPELNTNLIIERPNVLNNPKKKPTLEKQREYQNRWRAKNREECNKKQREYRRRKQNA